MHCISNVNLLIHALHGTTVQNTTSYFVDHSRERYMQLQQLIHFNHHGSSMVLQIKQMTICGHAGNLLYPSESYDLVIKHRDVGRVARQRRRWRGVGLDKGNHGGKSVVRQFPHSPFSLVTLRW